LGATTTLQIRLLNAFAIEAGLQLLRVIARLWS
jgi:hypothetical protein